MGMGISILAFVLAEGVSTHATRSRVEMEREYLKKHLNRERTIYRNITIQEPPDWHIIIAEFNSRTNEALGFTIQTHNKITKKLETRYDAENMKMTYKGSQWIIMGTKVDTIYNRVFSDQNESLTLIQDTVLVFPFQFTPKELTEAKIISEEKSVLELYKTAKRIRASGGKTHKWMTDVHLRFAFPLSNLFVVFICIPLVYNRHKKSIAEGVGISLLICFIYFGFIKMGQTLGHKRELSPFVGAWMGNGLAFIAGLWNLYRVRK
jgi:lipopolysaccharide export system permease protein